VLHSGAAETEHHEIAVYEGLITHPEAMGKSDVAELLKQNLEQEQHALPDSLLGVASEPQKGGHLVLAGAC
jgi:ferritin-like metal-binding protein YciE